MGLRRRLYDATNEAVDIALMLFIWLFLLLSGLVIGVGVVYATLALIPWD